MTNEKRLIDANELTDRLKHTTMVAYPNLFPGLLAAVEVVDDSATVDAVEVVHGYDTGRRRIFHCSECSYGVNDIFQEDERNYPVGEFNYCPNCGAKMDGDDDA